MTRLGYQIPNFTYPGVGPAELFEVVAAQAVEAEGSGFDTVFVMDHFYQLPMLGPPENYMLECYTTLAALARETSSARLSALVTGNTYRNPALLAKTLTALDIVSGGRAQLGIGAGWFEFEHNSLGFEFGTFTDRFEKLEEALRSSCRCCAPSGPPRRRALLGVRGAQPAAPGRRIPIMIGGSGEKTLRMVAQCGRVEHHLGRRRDRAEARRARGACGSAAIARRSRSARRSTSASPRPTTRPTRTCARSSATGASTSRRWTRPPAARSWPRRLGRPGRGGGATGRCAEPGRGRHHLLAAGQRCVPGRVELLGRVGTAALNG